MLAIDHIVIASMHPERDAKEFGEKNNIQVTPGGRHTNWGTYNYLAFLHNNSYIEWLGVFDEKIARNSDNPLIRQLIQFFDEGKSGAMTYALRTQKMDSIIDIFNKNMTPYMEPFPGSRKKPNGTELSWRMLFTEQQELPFLIEWGNGLNLPDDKDLINSQNLSKLKIPAHFDAYKNVFQFTESEDSVQLENGKLLFTKDRQLDFKITNSSLV